MLYKRIFMEICKHGPIVAESYLILISFYSPLHNAVLLANIKLVKRYSTVLQALGKSVDILNKQGLVSRERADG